MHRWAVVSAIARARAIGIIRTAERSTAVDVGGTLLDAGLKVVEVALTTPDGLDAISDLADRADRTCVVGAGTVLDSETAKLAITAGARFLVSPHLSRPAIETAHRYGVPAIPGAATPSEIVAALECGADLVKFFPASELGIGYLRALHAALPQAPLVPTGGITADTASDWLAAGAIAVGVGGSLTRGTPALMRRAAEALVTAVSQP